MQSSAENIWLSAQQMLRSMLNADIYNLWFQPIKSTALEGDTLCLEVANDFCELWLQNNYLGLIRDVLMQASGQELKIKFCVAPPPATATGSEPQPKPQVEVAENAPAATATTQTRENGFNPKSTFDTFVVGENNKHSHAAAMAVARPVREPRGISAAALPRRQ
jgi:chromosomal replication initiator protein